MEDINNKRYPDTEDGAKEFLEAASELKVTNETKFIIDPWVENVWKATNLNYGNSKVSAIIYLHGGYKNKDADGDFEINDFEIIDN